MNRTHKRKSVMKHQFSQVPKAQIQRSTFNRSHGLKTTFDGGLLIPILTDEALPGDTFKCRMTAFARLATPIHPIMDNMRMETFFFAVPNRLVWENWQKFCGEQDNPGDSTDYIIPSWDIEQGWPSGSMADYFGIPVDTPLRHSTLFHRAYNLIWNEWFRDQNLQDAVDVERGDDPGVTSQYPLQRRGKRHDYFTSCLPWPQKGEDVTLGLGQRAPVTGLGAADDVVWNLTGNTVNESGGGTREYANAQEPGYREGVDMLWEEDPDNPGFPNIYADLTQATAISINDLREAFQIQRLLERDARGGTRYIEIIKSHFGVTSPDARLQRPEYLGGGSGHVNISPVASTVPTSLIEQTPQGNLAAVGTALLNNHGFTKSFTEHSLILGFVSVRADLTYQQGLDRMFSRQTRYDYYWPALAHLGEQAVLNKEIYADGTAEDDEVFGYQERYAEYRYKPSRLTGLMRSNVDGSLDIWHLSQDFANRPTLSAEFIEDNPPIERVIAVPEEPHFILDAHFDMKCTRPMPLYGVPGLIDHF